MSNDMSHFQLILSKSIHEAKRNRISYTIKPFGRILLKERDALGNTVTNYAWLSTVL